MHPQSLFMQFYIADDNYVIVLLCRYRWLFFINPNYYGFSSTAYLLLKEFDSRCAGNELECYVSTGDYTLTQFNFNETNPALHVMVSCGVLDVPKAFISNSAL